MPIYFDSNKIKEVYKDGTSIKEVYNGSDLVFKKNVGIKCWGFSGGTYGYYVLDKYEVGSYWVIGGNAPITAINGTLGKSGSKVTVNRKGVGNISGSFASSIVIGGKTFFVYEYNAYTWFFFFVEEGSVVGNYCFDHPVANSSYGVTTVNKITDTSFTTKVADGTYTQNRNASADCFWSKELGFFKP